uniref:Uncharacterized protein n=1 Tax=Mimivirus LCMiAC02 TaxID=2506609 RepID=A0A4D5XFG0_9VIRU|nr:MAG: hypothetical protein LCMiAC02_03670 [Mimivirus LCMiAC02]
MKNIISDWLSSSKNYIKLIKFDENKLQFMMGKQKFILNISHTYSDDNDDIITVTYNSFDEEFVQEILFTVNEQQVKKKMKLTELLDYIEQQFEKYSKMNKDTIDSEDEDEYIIDSEDILIDDEDTTDSENKNFTNIVYEFVKDKKNNFSGFGIYGKDINDFSHKNTKINELYLKLRKISLKNNHETVSTDDNNNTESLLEANISSNILINQYIDILKKQDKRYKIGLVNNNIYHWKVLFSNFSNEQINNDLEEIKKKHKYNYIEIDISFDDKLFPNYPPIVKIIKPYLTDLLMKEIPRMNMLKFRYWTPCRDLVEIIEKLYDVLNTYGKINKTTEIEIDHKHDIINETCTIKETSFFDSRINQARLVNCITFEKLLIKLSSLYNYSKDSFDDTKYKIMYSTDHIIKTKYDETMKILTSISDIIEHGLSPTVCEILQKSDFVQIIIMCMKNIELLDIRKEIYKLMLNLISKLATENTVHILFTEINNVSIYHVIKRLSDEGLNLQIAVARKGAFYSLNGITISTLDIIDNLYDKIYKFKYQMDKYQVEINMQNIENKETKEHQDKETEEHQDEETEENQDEETEEHQDEETEEHQDEETEEHQDEEVENFMENMGWETGEFQFEGEFQWE